MSRKTEIFIPALEGKKIPILTLDNTWHKLFTQTEPTKEILEYEAKLNELLKKQGQINTTTKEIKNLKKKLMDEIVETMNELENNENQKAEKKLEEKKKLIEDCNQRLEQYNDDLLELPRLIDNVNYQLMLETMEVCYEQIQANNEEIEEISQWITSIRIELKKNVVRKQQKEIRNQNFYTYMHKIFGADVIDIFDMKYNITPISNTEVKTEDTNNQKDK